MTTKDTQVSGLILAGGRATRMGGIDKGLQVFKNKALVQWTLDLLQNQVATVYINANRSIEEYEQLGCTVLKDTLEGYLGPLAGMLAGLKQCPTPWLQITPCDTPFFPADLVAQLKQLATSQNTRIAMVASYSSQELSLKNCPVKQLDSYQVQPVFCLIHQSLSASLENYLMAGKAKIETWAQQENVAILEIGLSSHNALDFANINSHAELAQMNEQISQLVN